MTDLKQLTVDVHSVPGTAKFSYGGVLFEKCNLDRLNDDAYPARIRFELMSEFNLSLEDAERAWDGLIIESSGSESNPEVQHG